MTALSLRPRVVRGNLGVSSGTAQTFTMPLAAGTREFSERLPVQSGDSLALDVSTNSLIAMIIPAGAPMMHAAAGVGSFEMWSPPLLDGSTTAPLGGPIANQEPLYNADIEPDVDADGFGDETQDLCPAVASLQTTCVTTAISKLKLKRGLGFSLTISEASSLDLLVERLTPGRLRGGKCSTRAKRGARCSVAKRVKSIKNLAAGSGPVVIPYSTAKLKAGRYRVTVTAHNPNGLTSSKSAGFKIK